MISDFPLRITSLTVHFLSSDAQRRLVLGVLVFAQDITEQKRSEEALRGSEERLRAIIESSQNGIVMVNEEGTIVLVNEALAKIVRVSERPTCLATTRATA